MKEEQEFFGAGRSSFGFVHIDHVLEALSFTPSTVFLDLGCGKGDYSLAAAKAIGAGGRVYGVDGWQEGLDELEQRASAAGLGNVVTIRANINEQIPLEDRVVDVCFLATVLHDLLRESSGDAALNEITRVLRPGGRLAVVEFHKIKDSPGPPLSVRLSPEETAGVVKPFGFVREQVIEVGPFHYLFIASLAGR
jgi:ubiquinone/menaquinone biosynthesis C-methylase UbiE